MAAFGSPDLPAISNPTPTTSLAEVGGGVSAMNPMESVMAIFEDMRNGIDTLVGIATDTLKIEKENKTDADLLAGDKDDKGGGGDGKEGMFAGMMDSLKGAFSVDKEGLGSKLIKLAIAGAFLAITAFGDDLVKVLGPILKKGKEFLDKLSPKGKLYLGLAALAGLLFPKLLGTILFGIGKGSLKLAFKLLTTAFKLMQTFLSDGLIAGLKGAWKGMKGFVKGGMAVLKGAFNGMKTFIMDTVPGAIKGAYKAVKGFAKAGFELLKTGFSAMSTFITETVPGAIKGAYKAVKGFAAAGFELLKTGFNAMSTFITETVPGALKGAYKAVKGFATAGFELLKTGFSSLSTFITETVPGALKTAYSAVKTAATAGFELLKTGFSSMSTFITETIPGALKKSYKAVKGFATAGFELLKTGFSSMSTFITETVPGALKKSYSAVKGFATAGFELLKTGFANLSTFITKTIPSKMAGAYSKLSGLVAGGLMKLKIAFTSMQNFLLKDMPKKLAAAYGGAKGRVMRAVLALKVAFTTMRTFMMATMIPAITAFMAPFVVPLALLVVAVAAAIAIFTSIKAGIEDFKQSLAEGDSMLEAIVSGVTTALLTLVTLPITLIKNFVAWVAEKLGFEGIAEKLRDFSFVDFMKNIIDNVITKVKDFIGSLFDVDFGAFFAKIGNIGSIMLSYIKAIASGAKAGLLALFPGGDSPTEAYDKAFKKSMASSNAKMEADNIAKVKLSELTRLNKVKEDREKSEKKESERMARITAISNKNVTNNRNAVSLSNLKADHSDMTAATLNKLSGGAFGL